MLPANPHRVDVHHHLTPTLYLRRPGVRGVAGSGVLWAPKSGHVTAPRTRRLP